MNGRPFFIPDSARQLAQSARSEPGVAKTPAQSLRSGSSRSNRSSRSKCFERSRGAAVERSEAVERFEPSFASLRKGSLLAHAGP